MSIKSKIKTISWSLLGLCCVALLIAAMKTKDNKVCSHVEINIVGAAKHLFVKQADVIEVLNRNNIKRGEMLNNINLRKAEGELKTNAWIKDAQLFFDNHQTLHVKIREREPVARVFTVTGNSFYIDSTGLRLPVNENATARLIVFTSFPSDRNTLSKPDSLVLNDIKTIAQHINADSFLNAQTAQVNITTQRTYEITPVVGDEIIKIGNADSLNEKFSKLLLFYKQVIANAGFQKYSVIDVQYEGQVVAVRRGEGNTIADTARAVYQLKQAGIKLNKALNDTTYSAPLSEPVAVDGDSVMIKHDEIKTSVTKVSKPAVKKKVNKKLPSKKAKAVMKKKR